LWRKGAFWEIIHKNVKNFLLENDRPWQKAAGKRRRFPAGISDFFAHSYDFPIKWLTPFYPANPSQAAGSGEKCMNLRFLRLPAGC